MKIEIDLNDILGDEYGTETIQESVKRQVIDNLTNVIKQGVTKKIDDEVLRILNEQMRVSLTERMPSLIDEILTTEYQVVDKWGDRKNEKTTFRKEVIKSITEEMRYIPRNYDSEKNAFTRAVDGVIADRMQQFRKEYWEQVDKQFLAKAMEFAAKELAEKLKVVIPKS